MHGKICCLKHFSFQSVGSRVFSRRRWHSSLRALTSTRRPMKTHNTANMSSTANRNAPIHSPARTAQCCHSHTPERTLTGVVAYSDGPQQRRATLAGWPSCCVVAVSRTTVFFASGPCACTYAEGVRHKNTPLHRARAPCRSSHFAHPSRHRSHLLASK